MDVRLWARRSPQLAAGWRADSCVEQCEEFSLWCVQCKAFCRAQCAVCSVQYMVSGVQCAVRGVEFGVCSVWCAVNYVQYMVCSIWCVVHGFQLKYVSVQWELFGG